MITLDTTNDWNLVDVDNISGRLNVMWLTPEGVGISTREYSHMTILNMICEKSNNHDFWDIEKIKNASKKNFPIKFSDVHPLTKNLNITKDKMNLMEKFWINSGFKASKEKLLSLLS